MSTTKERMRQYRARQAQRGMVEATEWIPFDKREALAEFAADLRQGHKGSRPKEDVAALVEEMRAMGDGWLRVAAKLNSQGIGVPAGMPWTDGAVRRFMREMNSPR